MNAESLLMKLRSVNGNFTVKAAIPTGTVANIGREIFVFDQNQPGFDDCYPSSLSIYMKQRYESEPVTVSELIEIITNHKDASSMEEVEFWYDYISDILAQPDAGSYPVCGITAIDDICYIRCRYSKGLSMDEKFPED